MADMSNTSADEYKGEHGGEYDAGNMAAPKPPEPGPGTSRSRDGSTGAYVKGGDFPDFDPQRFLSGLDAIYSRHEGASKAEPYMTQALERAAEAGDEPGQLTVINELMGFYRSQSRHEDNIRLAHTSLDLALHMGLEGTAQWLAVLINAATAMRAAGHYDESLELYEQALSASTTAPDADPRNIAALHNNLSMLYSETGDLGNALEELRKALDMITLASPDPANDIDIATTKTNIALLLLQRPAENGGGGNHREEPGNRSTENGENSGNNAKGTSGTDNCADCGSAVYSRDIQEALDYAREALDYAREALEIYHHDPSLSLTDSAHYASALAGYAQALLMSGAAAEAQEFYDKALQHISKAYGTQNDYYRTTLANARSAREIAEKQGQQANAADPVTPVPRITKNMTADMVSSPVTGIAEDMATDGMAAGPAAGTAAGPAAGTAEASAESMTKSPAVNVKNPDITGLELSQQYWEKYGRPLLRQKYPQYAGRIASGLVGHGSECYGFDDRYSRDHDFGPRFCLWLTDDDYAEIGSRLQEDYDSLPKRFMGYSLEASASTPRSQGERRRSGVFRIGDFFGSVTGLRHAPGDDEPLLWLNMDEATLAAATNGKVFADPLGAFSSRRQGFKNMPDDVRLALISQRAGMISQSGQYNFPRMSARGDAAAAMLCIYQFAEAVTSLVFLINNPLTVGYAPYYKWRFAALRSISARPATRLPQVCGQLEQLMGSASDASRGQRDNPAYAHANALISQICNEIVAELRYQGLTSGSEDFLEWHRPYIESHISQEYPFLRSL